jgi:hypothetical protein
MTVFLDRIDSAPLFTEEFSFEYNSWVSVLIDTLNETLSQIQDRLNKPQLEPTTQAQIIAEAVNAPDGSIWYCDDHIPPVYVGKISGALVQFVTAAFP